MAGWSEAGAEARPDPSGPDTRGVPSTRQPWGHRHQLHQEQSSKQAQNDPKDCSC